MLVPTTKVEKEVLTIFQATENLKFKTILMLIYSAGLRQGELLKLRVVGLHVDTGKIFIKSGKGKKERYTILAEQMKSTLNTYTALYRCDLAQNTLHTGVDRREQPTLVCRQ